MGHSLGRVYHPSGKLLWVNSILIQHHASCLFAGCQLRSLLARSLHSWNVRDKVNREVILALPDIQARGKPQYAQMPD